MATKKHILMVDDVSTNLKCVEEVLRDWYKLSMVKSGVQAFQFMEKVIPDMILLDINMPDMNGYEMLEKLNCNSQLKDIPVVFLTADIDMESEEKARKLGAVDYLKKPFDPKEMLKRISIILGGE